MAADGFTRAPLAHADGVYLNLSMEDYLRDDALSGSAFKKLLSDPAALWWESEQNPLWLRPEPRADRARLRGRAAHCMILEGEDAYAARFVVKPDDVLSSEASLKAWLSEKRKAFIADSVDGKLSKEDAEAVKQTGSREDLIARIRALDCDAPIWDPDARCETLHPTDDQYVRLLDRFVRCDPTFAPLITDGLPEVSIFWSEDGLRFKARIDYLTPHTILDLKTYGRAPRRGNDLKRHCLFEATFNGYDIQAAHNAHAVAQVQRFHSAPHCVEHGFSTHASGPGAFARIEQLGAIINAHASVPPIFRWLFLRMGGAPTGISIPFRESAGQWAEAKRQIGEACNIYRAFRAKFGETEPWLVTHGEQEIDDIDWPFAAIGAGAEIEGDEA